MKAADAGTDVPCVGNPRPPRVTRLKRQPPSPTPESSSAALITPLGVATGVVIVEGLRAVYVYPADASGDIADFDVPLATLPAGTSPAAALRSLGYDAAA